MVKSVRPNNNNTNSPQRTDTLDDAQTQGIHLQSFIFCGKDRVEEKCVERRARGRTSQINAQKTHSKLFRMKTNTKKSGKHRCFLRLRNNNNAFRCTQRTGYGEWMRIHFHIHIQLRNLFIRILFVSSRVPKCSRVDIIFYDCCCRHTCVWIQPGHPFANRPTSIHISRLERS